MARTFKSIFEQISGSATTSQIALVSVCQKGERENSGSTERERKSERGRSTAQPRGDGLDDTDKAVIVRFKESSVSRLFSTNQRPSYNNTACVTDSTLETRSSGVRDSCGGGAEAATEISTDGQKHIGATPHLWLEKKNVPRDRQYLNSSSDHVTARKGYLCLW
ncbi:hypothetical protein J6590_042938 [Homalodisca vitripennis]|nr:hypothetical protein J6590_042938 [Homalodisca vitripennis]